MNARDELISIWKNFEPEKMDPKAPLILPRDEPLLDKQLHRKVHYCRFQNWEDYIKGEIGAPSDDKELHLGLLPIPYIGNLEKASVFVLMLNPSFGHDDYYGEYKVREFRDALIDNLHQTSDCSFMFFQPRFSWHGGYRYWHGKFGKLIDAHARATKKGYGEARKNFERYLAVIQLVPYRSNNSFYDAKIDELELESVRHARNFARHLCDEAKAGKCLVIFVRGVKYWDVEQATVGDPNIVVYAPKDARSASLGPESEGGNAILKYLRSKVRQER
jgi:hypothetical protein